MQIKQSLLRTIAGLKSECDVFEKLFREQEQKTVSAKRENDNLLRENQQLQEQMRDHQERFCQLIEENETVLD